MSNGREPPNFLLGLGREPLIEKVVSSSEEDRIWTITGGGGIGKSKFLKLFETRVNSTGSDRAIIINFGELQNSTKISFWTAIAFNIGNEYFSEFVLLNQNYAHSSGVKRSKILTDLRTQFVNGIARASSLQKIYLLFDFVANTSNLSKSYLKELIDCSTGLNTVFVVAARNSPAFLDETSKNILLSPIKVDDVIELHKSILCAPPLNSAKARKVLWLSDGIPLLISTVFELVRTGCELNFFLADSKELFFHNLLESIERIGADEFELIQLMIAVEENLDSEMTAHIFKGADARYQSALENLKGFSFILINNFGNSICLHDHFAYLFKENRKDIYSNFNDYREKVSRNYCQLKLVGELSQKERQRIIALKVKCEIALDENFGTGVFVQECKRAIDRYDVDFAKSLIDIALNCGTKNNLIQTTELLMGQLALRCYETDIAFPIYTRLLQCSKSEPNRVAALFGRAVCSINVCPRPEVDPYDSIDDLLECLEFIDKEGALISEQEVLHALGLAYRTTGQHNKAEGALKKSIKISIKHQDYKLALSGHEECSVLYRLQQNLDLAQREIDFAARIRVTQGVSDGIEFANFQIANIKRDLDQFTEARELYRQIEKNFLDSGDPYQICSLYSDWAWLEYLDGDLASAEDLQNKSFELASKHRFGADIADHWHTQYHFSMDKGNSQEANKYLEQGYNLATRYHNIYIALDCLMHLVQRDLEKGEIEPAHSKLLEMKSYEDKGCLIRVFRGRALIYLGDHLTSVGNRNEACDRYIEGFAAVAQYGNSRSNVELFEDYFEQRKTIFNTLLTEFNKQQTFARIWINLGLEAGFPAVLEAEIG